MSRGMSRRWGLLGFAAVVVLAASAFWALVAAGSPGRAQAVSCGDTVTQSISLTADLNCPGVDGLLVGADGITINLGGHTIAGDATVSTTGVKSTSHAGVKIINGTIIGFEFGVYLSGSPDSSVSSLLVRSSSYGIRVYASDGTTVSKNRVLLTTNTALSVFSADGVTFSGNTTVGSPTGISVEGSNATVKSNTVSSAGTGIYVARIGDVITRNTVSASVTDGIVVTFNESEVTGNLVQGSGSNGIEVSGGDGNSVGRNRVIGSAADGIHVGANSDGNTLERNTSTANAGSGIFVASDSDGALISGNQTSSNRGSGIESDNADPSTRIGKNTANTNGVRGIEAAAGVTDLGGNKASSNGTENCSSGVITCV